MCSSRESSLRMACLVVAGVLIAAPSLAQRPNYKLFTDPDRRFSVEFPQDWDWMNVSPAGESLAVFIHPRKEAAVVVERERLKVKPEVITETFAEGEALRLKAPVL